MRKISISSKLPESTIDKRGQGEFVFGTVNGWLDCRLTEREGLPFVEFSWEGLSKGDQYVWPGMAFNPTGVSKGTYSST